MSLNLKLIFLLAGGFVLLSPTSVAGGLSISEPAKYFRLLTTILIVAIGLASAGQLRIGAGGRALIAFSTLFVIASVWSTKPAYGLFNKGMFGLTCLSGIILAASIRTTAELRAGLRLLGLVSGAAALVVLLVFLKAPGQVQTNDRMAVFGINPNMIGHTAVPLSILCMYVAINDRRTLWKTLMIGACCLLGLIIIATGCRGAALTLVIGTACLLAPYSRRPGVMLGVLVGIALVAFVGFEVLEIGGSNRMVSEFGKDTRQGVWRWALKSFQKSPIFGVGWFHYGSKWAMVQSMYIQTLVETGIVGAMSLIGTLCLVAIVWFSSLQRLHKMRAPTGICYLALSLLLMELAQGLTESSPLAGTTLASLVLGLSVGLTDRVVDLSEVGRPLSRHPFPNNGTNPPARRRPSAREVLDSLQQQQAHLPTTRSN